MRRWVVLMPDSLEVEGEAPLFDSGHPHLATMGSRGRIVRIEPKNGSTSEADWIGLDSTAYGLEPGPLMVAALGAKPPERSVHFHLSLMSLDDGVAQASPFEPTSEDLLSVVAAAKRLQTPKLKFLEGFGLDHGLVWEQGSIELRCQSPEQIAERHLAECFPEGDGEPMWRRFIDDSVNLLSDLECNAIRIEEGLPPLNLLWPWGPGFEPSLPNLSVQRGMSVRVDSPSHRLAGLCRLSGYWHGDPWNLGRGTNMRLETMARSALESPAWLGVIPGPTEGGRRKAEESQWLGREVLSRLVEPLLEGQRKTPARLLIVALDTHGSGLALDFRSDGPPESIVLPFSAEVAGDKRLASQPLHQLIAEAFTV